MHYQKRRRNDNNNNDNNNNNNNNPSILDKQEHFLKPNSATEPHQRNKYLSSPSCKILRTILKINKRGTQVNGPKDKKGNDDAQRTIRLDMTGWGRHTGTQGIVQEIKFRSYYKMVYAQTRIHQSEPHKFFLDFEVPKDHLIRTRRLDLLIINKERELAISWILLSHWITMKIKRREKSNRYLDLARELRKL